MEKQGSLDYKYTSEYIERMTKISEIEKCDKLLYDFKTFFKGASNAKKLPNYDTTTLRVCREIWKKDPSFSGSRTQTTLGKILKYNGKTRKSRKSSEQRKSRKNRR
jgi:hypothetical protein